MKAATGLPVPSIQDVARMEPELNQWTRMAAQAFGLYSGINEAIKSNHGKGGWVAHHATEFREQMILMALIRSFAVMDRQSEVSFQSVYRFLKTPAAQMLVAEMYASTEPVSSFENAKKACKEPIEKYLATYTSIIPLLGQVQSFRNSDIAHITWPEVQRAKVTYSDVERFVRGCCVLAGQLSLMIAGKNDWPEEDLEHAHTNAYRFWRPIIASHYDGRLETILDL